MTTDQTARIAEIRQGLSVYREAIASKALHRPIAGWVDIAFLLDHLTAQQAALEERTRECNEAEADAEAEFTPEQVAELQADFDAWKAAKDAPQRRITELEAALAILRRERDKAIAEYNRLNAEYDAFLADHGHDGCAMEAMTLTQRAEAAERERDEALASLALLQGGTAEV